MIESILNEINNLKGINMLPKILYSPSHKACYCSDFGNASSIPSDAVSVDFKNYQEYCGNPPPEGKEKDWDYKNHCFFWSDIPKPTIDECKDAKLKEITIQYNDLVYADFQSDGVSYESTLENQNRIMMAKMSGGGMVIDGGVMVNLTATQADQVFSDMNTYIDGCNERYAKAQAEISEATTNDQVNAVVL